ncbi:hypothetical protein NEF87_000736 [Candidatus Lokiarchaeum ossiferum]|uniref:DUF5671 domain-containing protein n=1 Tax=Candidatus Lokiarchaeum ossiferum TaxID=2951803 RepID=A0ABY6HM11_9ARCH|nr:hypothetical protein NEF87_000736 [Candidatus Lokiarchaeum sp. B-35]
MNQFDSNNIEEPYNQAANFLIIITTFLTTAVYLLILFILNWTFSQEPPQENRNEVWVYANMNLLVYISIGLSIGILLLSHGYLFKKFHQKYRKEDPYRNHFTYLLILFLNLGINSFGLALNVFSLTKDNKLNWPYLIGFIGVGWCNLIYIYQKHTPAIYRKFSFKSPSNQEFSKQVE